ncbi:MAG: hypothetical protein ACRDUV_13025 [Pseudonocardiaceae bacterium]
MGFTNGHVVPVTASHRSSSTTQSPLAQMMDLPYPQEPKNKAGCGLLLIVLTSIFLTFIIMTTKSEMKDTVVNSPYPIASIIGFIIGFMIMFGPLLLGGIVLIKKDGSDRKGWEQRKKRWQQAMQVWLTLRYCHRDHVVYRSPDVIISPAMVQKFVYDQVTSLPVVKGTRRA